MGNENEMSLTPLRASIALLEERCMNNGYPRKKSGTYLSGKVQWSLLLLLLLIASPVGWIVFAEARKNYWDDRVRELCAKDGGIKVAEPVQLDSRYLDAERQIRIPIKPSSLLRSPFKWEAQPNDLYFFTPKIEIIRNENPRVARNIVEVVRSSDGKVLGYAVRYGRVGGDPFVIDSPTRKYCPEDLTESDLFKAIFVVQNR